MSSGLSLLVWFHSLRCGGGNGDCVILLFSLGVPLFLTVLFWDLSEGLQHPNLTGENLLSGNNSSPMNSSASSNLSHGISTCHQVGLHPPSVLELQEQPLTWLVWGWGLPDIKSFFQEHVWGWHMCQNPWILLWLLPFSLGGISSNCHRFSHL